MASERQVEANRRNARNSTGPRSTSGKKRASKNAFRHGLTKRMSSAAFDREVETLAHQIAGDTEDKITIELARDAAAADLELARVRRVKVALIERVSALGALHAPRHDIGTVMKAFLYIELALDDKAPRGRPPEIPELLVDPLPEMPSQEPQRTAEAMRRILPELLKLHRYESRAVTRRDRAIRAIASRNIVLS